MSFETAAQVFLDPNAYVEMDRVEDGEVRWLTIGRVEGSLVLLVAHTVVDDDGVETIRIISARQADRRERGLYEKANDEI